jgi:hypothetical protein
VDIFVNHLKRRECHVVCPFFGCGYEPSLVPGHQSIFWDKTLCTLANHIKAKHTREAKLECPVCGKKSVSFDAHRYHVKQHDNKRKFYCEPCQKFFPIVAKQKHENKYHSYLGNFPCVVCNKKFATEGNLQLHMRIHASEFAYKCEHCPRQFHQKNNLFVHCVRKHGRGTDGVKVSK